MLLRQLIIPLALVCLGLGFVLWRFMGDIPSVLSMGLEVLVDGLAHGGRRPARSPALPIAYPVDAGIDAMRAGDASFSAASFLADVQRIGGLLRAGWEKRDLADCRSLMTDACWDLQAAQLARPVADGWRPFAETVTMNAESIVALRSEPGIDRITVRMGMQCPPGTGKVIRGRRIHEWIEDWTLIRPRVSSPAAGWLVDAMNHVAVHLERAA